MAFFKKKEKVKDYRKKEVDEADVLEVDEGVVKTRLWRKAVRIFISFARYCMFSGGPARPVPDSCLHNVIVRRSLSVFC